MTQGGVSAYPVWVTILRAAAGVLRERFGVRVRCAGDYVQQDAGGDRLLLVLLYLLRDRLVLLLLYHLCRLRHVLVVGNARKVAARVEVVDDLLSENGGRLLLLLLLLLFLLLGQRASQARQVSNMHTTQG